MSSGQITADLTNYQVTVDDRPIELTPKEFELLVYFMKRKDRVIDRDTLLDRIWNFDFAGQSRIVDVHVSHLREKIERDPKHPKYLITVGCLVSKFQEPKILMEKIIRTRILSYPFDWALFWWLADDLTLLSTTDHRTARKLSDKKRHSC